jgi:hypothetical protein
MVPKRPDLDALRKEAAEAVTDPKERAELLRDLDALEKMLEESDRKEATLHAELAASLVHPYKPVSRARLAVIFVLCMLFVLVVPGFWLPQALDTGVLGTSRYRPVTAGETPIEYWVTVGAALVSTAGAAFAAVFALFALVRYPNHPFRRAAAAAPGLASVPVDPLAEAEVYLAYGRKEQAIEVLKEGLAREPQRKDVATKLAALRKR